MKNILLIDSLMNQEKSIVREEIRSYIQKIYYNKYNDDDYNTLLESFPNIRPFELDTSINENLEIELKEIKIILDPFRLKLNAKTVGSKLKNKNKVLEIEKINTQIPLKSLLNENSIIESLEISTKSIKIKDLISFIRVINNNAELYLLEKVVKKGFLIADVKLYFDKDGNIKNNYEISGFVKDTKIKILKNYRLNKLNLNFSYKKNVLDFKNISVSLNNLNFVSKNLNFKNIKDEFIIKGEIGNKSIVLDNKNIELFIKPHFPDLDIDKIIFSSKNKF